MDRYKSVTWELGLPAERSRAAAYRSIGAEITRQVREVNRLPVLIIDEAQSCAPTCSTICSAANSTATSRTTAPGRQFTPLPSEFRALGGGHAPACGPALRRS